MVVNQESTIRMEYIRMWIVNVNAYVHTINRRKRQDVCKHPKYYYHFFLSEFNEQWIHLCIFASRFTKMVSLSHSRFVSNSIQFDSNTVQYTWNAVLNCIRQTCEFSKYAYMYSSYYLCMCGYLFTVEVNRYQLMDGCVWWKFVLYCLVHCAPADASFVIDEPKKRQQPTTSTTKHITL